MMLVSPTLAVGASGGNASKPTLSAKVFDYYLAKNPAHISIDNSAKQMTVLMGRGRGVDEGTAVVADGDLAVIRSNSAGTSEAYFL